VLGWRHAGPQREVSPSREACFLMSSVYCSTGVAAIACAERHRLLRSRRHGCTAWSGVPPSTLDLCSLSAAWGMEPIRPDMPAGTGPKRTQQRVLKVLDCGLLPG